MATRANFDVKTGDTVVSEGMRDREARRFARGLRQKGQKDVRVVKAGRVSV